MADLPKKKHNHGGHRQRLLSTIMEAGIDKVSDVVALEFILTYVIPRCDTNDLAHRLLDRFGSAANVLNTDWDLLKEVEGMGETSAKKLHCLIDIFDYYTDQLLDKKYVFEYRSDISDFFEELLRFKNIETSYIIGVDASNRVKSKHKLSVGGVLSVGVSTHDVAKFITSVKPAYVFLAHNHPQGKAIPSKGDIEGTRLIENLLNSLGVPLVDHVIVGIDGIFSMKENSFYREFKK